MPKRLPKYLEFPRHQRPYLLHPLTIDAEIAVARAGSRTEVNRLRAFIEEELDVIDEAEQEAGELVVEIGLVLIDKLGPRQGCERCFQRLFCFGARLLVLERRNRVALVSRLSRDAVGAGRAGGKSPYVHDETVRSSTTCHNGLCSHKSGPVPETEGRP